MSSKRQSGGLFSIVKNWVFPVVIGIAVAKGLTMWVASAAECVSGSMEPTIPYPTRILVDKVAVELGQPYRGEVIMFHHPKNSVPEDPLLKRIIGIPGDTVEIKDGVLYINGKKVNEPYVVNQDSRSFGPYHVPAGKYFVLGDNRPISLDARFWENHFVPKQNILGRVDAVFWPPADIHLVH